MAEVFDFGLQQHKIKMDGKFFESNLFAVAGDTGRRLEVQLLDSNNMIQNTTGISLRLNANVAGQATYAEATLVDATKGLYELDLPNGMLIAPGNWQFQWQIIGASGEKLHSFAFTGSVGSNLSEGGSEATNFYLNVEDLKQMQEDLINGTFDSVALETNIAGKLNNLEETYAPRLTEVTTQLEQDQSRITENTTKIGTHEDKINNNTGALVNLNTKIGQLGTAVTFKGSDTNANILSITNANVGDEWYDTTNKQSLRWNGNSWIPVGSEFKLGDRMITPENTTFFVTGKNLFNPADVIDGVYINQATGEYMPNAAHKATKPIVVEPNENYVPNQLVTRFAFFEASGKFISGGTTAGAARPFTTPPKTATVVMSSESWDVNTMQLEKGSAATEFEPYRNKIDDIYLPDQPSGGSNEGIIADPGKKYRMIGANIRTPLAAGLPFQLHNDTGHEPMGITSVTIVGDELRVGMPFTAKKVITMTVVPHVSMMQEGYSVATTGGLSVHAVHFFKNGVRVPASELVLNGGSFWISGVFLI